MKDRIIEKLAEEGGQTPLSTLTERLGITRETLPAFSAALLALQHGQRITVTEQKSSDGFDSNALEDIVVLNAETN